MILVFVGAGGSAAVDPDQYPTTIEFFNRLPDAITNTPLFPKVRDFLQAQKKDKGTIDIEDVLEVLDELQADFKKITDPKTIAGWAMGGHTQIIGSIELSGVRALEKDHVTPLNNKVKEQVYKFYGTPPSPSKLSAWIRLLKGLEETDSPLEIFTTNYDLVLEDAIEEAKVKVECGLDRRQRRTRLDLAAWNSHIGLLTKLHGSVDWQYDNGNIAISTPRFTEDHDNHCILYPGYKGAPTQGPFNVFHQHLRKVVREEYEPLAAAIFIGFAFRDDYINSILADLPSEIPMCFITKAGGELADDKQPPRAPSSNSCMHLRGGLTEESVEVCLKHVSENIRRERLL